jgi:hypothetical protein
VGAAVDWIERQFLQISPRLLRPIGRIGILDRANTAYEALPYGRDVQWAAQLRRGRTIHICVVCCPNRRITHVCPQQEQE